MHPKSSSSNSPKDFITFRVLVILGKDFTRDDLLFQFLKWFLSIY